MTKHWYPVISTSKCVQCGSCIEICPENLLIFSNSSGHSNLFDDSSYLLILTDSEKCRPNCFKCAKVCRRNAIGIIRPAKPCDCCSF